MYVLCSIVLSNLLTDNDCLNSAEAVGTTCKT